VPPLRSCDVDGRYDLFPYSATGPALRSMRRMPELHLC
jgi:hypothetical protein